MLMAKLTKQSGFRPVQSLPITRHSSSLAHDSPPVHARRIAVRSDPVIALGLVWLVMLLVQNATPGVISLDGYYHIKFARLMWEQGPRVEFPYLPFTILNPRDFTDHHLLYHLFLMPFALGDLRSGAKLAGLAGGVGAIFSVYWLMTRLKARRPLFWLVLLLASAEWFLVRQSMTRRQSLSLLILVVATWLLVTRRYRWLAPVGFLYAWLFDGFVLLIAVAGLGVLAVLVAERRLVWGIAGWLLLGIAAALLLNPYFPHNVSFTYLHVLPKLQPDSAITVGNEWYPYPLDALLGTSWLALLMVPLGLLPGALRPSTARRDAVFLLLAGLAVLMLVLYCRSRRFVEYFPAFATLLCAHAWGHLGPGSAGRDGPLRSAAYAVANLRFPPRWRGLARFARRGLALLVLVAVGVQAVHTLRQATLLADDGRDPSLYREASQFIARNSAPLAPVFNTDWDDFPVLFFHNTHNTYMVGLDPMYMVQADRERYLLWQSITRGQVERPSEAIRASFGAAWVLTDRRPAHAAFVSRADQDPGLQRALDTSDAIVYRMLAP
jgi:hypothetical protein